MKLSRYRGSFVAVAALALLTAVCGGSLAADNLGGATVPGSSGHGARAGASPALHAKKKCRFVRKKVHGRVRKVRVCTKVKPKPKPTPSLPSKVSVTLDSAHAATASISAAAGGTLSAAGATLTVPAGAVAGTTTVTMTPVTRLGGLRGHVLGAVQFAPDGLQFQKPVTLTIPVSSTNGLQGFTYRGNGASFHLYPMTVADGKATFVLVHLSGYGLGEQLPPSGADRVRGLLNIAKPLAQRATYDPRYFLFAVVAADQFVLELVHLPSAEQGRFDTDLKALLTDVGVALERFADDLHAKCVETHDVVGTGKELKYTYSFLIILLALPVQRLREAWPYAVAQRAKCESFELDFRSTVTWTSANRCGPIKIVSRVRAEKLKLNNANSWGSEQGLDYWSFETTPGCDVNTGQTVQCTWKTRADDPFSAKLAPVSSPTSADWYDGGSPPHISMQVFVGKASELRTSCGGTQYGDTDVWPFWTLGMSDIHHALRWTIEDWKYVGGAVFAERKYTGSANDHGDAVTEETTFTLRHTPE